MNILFFCQSRSLDVFHQTLLRLQKRFPDIRAGFYVADLFHYEGFLKKHPSFEKDFAVLGQWDICREAVSRKPDWDLLNRYEKEIGDPTLWAPLVTDRRLWMGRNASYFQDYAPALSFEKTASILTVALEKIDAFMQRIQPDLVLTLYTATFGDCLAHLFAKAKKIRSLDLRLSRIQNRVAFCDGVVEPPPHIVRHFHAFRDEIPPSLRTEAENYIRGVQEHRAIYEGAMPAKEKRLPVTQATSKSWHDSAVKAMRLLESEWKRHRAPYCFDLLPPGVLQVWFQKKIRGPWHVHRVRKTFKNRFVRKEQLENLDYVLYPLHVEPELVLSQFARPFLNQIEVVRNSAFSIPVGMKLLVKEHPMMVGRRTFSYYRKLLEIPNVELLDLDLASDTAIRHARAVIILRGSIGLEAAILKKPVLSLGQSLFDLLPSSLYRKCTNLYELPQTFTDLLAH